MADCCEDKSCALEQLRERQNSTLKTVLWINAVMFVVVVAAGVYVRRAVQADFARQPRRRLVRSMTYTVTRDRVKGMVSVFKGVLILSAALFVIGQIGYKLAHPGVPLFDTMAGVAALALIANGTCLALLWKHREEDVRHVPPYGECSRNDIAANLAVLLAAGGVWALWVRMAGRPS